jgi:hypothetical protein
MANDSGVVEIETRTEHGLSIALQGVADDQPVNVGTLLSVHLNLIRRRHASIGDRTNVSALRGVVLAFAFLAFGRIDLVNDNFHADSGVRALNLARSAYHTQVWIYHISHAIDPA